FQVVATDGAGNTSPPLSHPVTVTLQPQGLSVTIDYPPSGLITREGATRVEGSVQGPGSITVNVSANGSAIDATPSGGRDLVPALPWSEGDNVIAAVARTPAGRQSDPYSVPVTRDSIPPTVDLHVPATIGLGKTGQGQADATDNHPGVTVEIQGDVVVPAG